MLACSMACTSNVSTRISKDDLDETLSALISEGIESSFNRTPGISMSIISRDKGIDWSGAGGFDSKDKEKEVEVDQPFRIASITKTFVAASILRLHEMDSLSIGDSIGKYISEEHKKILESDGYDLEDITIRHCLDHTAGLYDYAVGENTKYKGIVLENRDKRWTRTEQLQGAVDWGDKLGEPGDQYEYSDTGYILLGETIENFFFGDLAKGLRALVGYDKLGLDHTWLESLEDAPQGMKEPVHIYFGREDMTTIDPSIDLYGGGGIVSTTRDLVSFVDALFNGGIFENDATLKLMLSEAILTAEADVENNPPSKDYRCGIYKIDLFGEEAYVHSGMWDVYVLHRPSTNTSIATNFTNYHRYRMVKKVIRAIDQLPNSTLTE